MDTEFKYGLVKGDLRIAWDAHHQWLYVELMYQDWQRELPDHRATIEDAYRDFEAEIQPFGAPVGVVDHG